MTDLAPNFITPLRSLDPRRAIIGIIVLTIIAMAFLLWLIYSAKAQGTRPTWVSVLPSVNASLNGISSIFIISGFIAIRRRKAGLHVRLMVAALASSLLFLVSYLVYHAFQGDTKFLGTGIIRPVYFFVLISHILLAAVALLLVMMSVYLALAGNWIRHRRLSRWTMPIWLYVSVTGVLIFAMLKLFNTAP